MFRFHIDHPVKLADLQWTGDGRWANHDSWIEPLTHPVLEHRAVLGPDGRGFVINRERRRGTAGCSPAPAKPLGAAAYERERLLVTDWPSGSSWSN